MHYIINDCLIKSENAASCTSLTNAKVLEYISALPNGITVLDYGCGKCRYSRQLSEKSSRLILVDSEIQISRKQIIHGAKVSVKEFAELELKNAKAYTIEDDEWKKVRYDFVLCTNVLSAIPSISERNIVLRNIAHVLKSDGVSLITVQFRNSYFSTYALGADSQRHEDGWIVKKGNAYSFYGIIMPDKLVEMCTQAGLAIVDRFQKDGSIYLLVSKSE